MDSIRMTHVTALILHAVAAGHRYGFDIMDATGLASGTVYPALRRLEEARVLRGRWEDEPAASRGGRPQRRTYELTKVGEVAVVEARDKLASQRALLADGPAASEV